MRRLLLIFVLALVALTGCQEKNEKVEKQKVEIQENLITETSTNINKIVEWEYDITGDSVNEKIVVNVSYGKCNNEDSVEVFSGKTGKKIWGMHLCEEHIGSVGIIAKEEKNNIYIWNEDDVKEEYCLEVLDISEDGKSSVSEKYESDFEIGKDDEEEIKKIFKYHDDTVFMTIDGHKFISYSPEVSYSTPEVTKKDGFYENTLIGDIVTDMYEKSENIAHNKDCSRSNDNKQDTLNVNDKIEWSYDVTGDSVKEKIIVQILDPYAEEKQNTVEIYSGKTGKLIWKTFISSPHMAQGSVGIINKDGRDYIYEWNPYMTQGKAYYTLKILDIDDEGNSKLFEEYNLAYDMETASEKEIKEILEYQTNVNGLFKDSMCLISYLPEEMKMYSMPENIKKNELCTNDVKDIIGGIIYFMHIRDLENN